MIIFPSSSKLKVQNQVQFNYTKFVKREDKKEYRIEIKLKKTRRKSRVIRIYKSWPSKFQPCCAQTIRLTLNMGIHTPPTVVVNLVINPHDKKFLHLKYD